MNAHTLFGIAAIVVGVCVALVGFEVITISITSAFILAGIGIALAGATSVV